ncbi:MAG: hypothetical protein ACLUEK_05405 [Oscillospiraceae bacterium]
MLLILQITQLDYGDAALCALSALRGRAEDPGSAASRLLEALESVPPELIRRLLDAIPDRDKAALAASLARENEARIRELAGEAAHRAGVSLSVRALSDGLGSGRARGHDDRPRAGAAALARERLEVSWARPRRCCRLLGAGGGLTGLWAVCPRRGRAAGGPPASDASGRAAALIEEEAAKRGLRLKLGRLSVSAGWSA